MHRADDPEPDPDPKTVKRQLIAPLGWVRIALFGSLLGSVALPDAPEPIRVFNAAALGPSFRQLLLTMQSDRLVSTFVHQSAPSLEVVRRLTEFGDIPDVLAVADVALLDSLVLPRHSSWYLVFGTGALVLAYGPRSAHANEITADNWTEVLLRPGVRIGRSDLRVDPSGYRTLMATELAERHYRRPGLAAALLKAMPDRFMRRAEADLSALIQSGELDYIWTYRNLALGHHLQWLELPREINLEDQGLASWYAQAVVTIPGAAQSRSLTLHGAPILFALTIPRGARSPSLGESFIRRLLAPGGRAMMAASGFTMLPRPTIVGSDAPAFLQSSP